MPVDCRLSGAMATEMENSTKTKMSGTTPSDDAKKAITSPSSAESWRADESKPPNEPVAAAVLTGSLSDLTLIGHFSDTKSPEGIESTRGKAKGDNHKDPPGPDHVRAILFPDSEKSPKFIWLKTNDRTLDLDKLDEKLEVAHVLGLETGSQIGQQQITLTKDTQRQSMPGSRANAQPHLLLREDCFVDGSKPNLSIGTVTSGKFQFSWRGPIVAVKTSPKESDVTGASPVLIDITITDYRDLIDFFRDYGQYEEGVEDFGPISFWWLAPALKQKLISQPQFLVVRLSCDSEYEATKNKYSPFEIGVGHPAMAFLRPCPVTTRIGIPLVVRRSPTDNAYKADAEATGNTNYGPNLLLMNVDPESDNWGRVPENRTQGSVVVMRPDSLDLHPHHLEAIIMYLKDPVLPALRDSIGPNPERTRSSVLGLLIPNRFFIYYTMYKKMKIDIDETWKSTPDPKGYSGGTHWST
ncbi:MAG: hypothetical protein Q9184_002013 [Pyrenodesmia sp. 2 TL-2023]